MKNGCRWVTEFLLNELAQYGPLNRDELCIIDLWRSANGVAVIVGDHPRSVAGQLASIRLDDAKAEECLRLWRAKE